ncbi:DUF2255 family protein [Leuconostoc falkenbergense]|uniref:DUF2255 family protein n=1 Tax=Leuconostoc falkenbergense TaxID=2766470 RepID=UPI0024AE8262|nr:DUF2255 family protein [Leuconostoc falkenbergense]MDI6666706.1 DUF2255 family protein [Leuconostoc falkenbergense]
MNWTIAQLQKIDQNDDLHIAPVRKNGDIGTPTWIWEVIVDNRLFVRAYNGVHSSWYQSALENNGGIIEAAGERHNVVFVHIDKEIWK